jgi:hypothetical protein
MFAPNKRESNLVRDEELMSKRESKFGKRAPHDLENSLNDSDWSSDKPMFKDDS